MWLLRRLHCESVVRKIRLETRGFCGDGSVGNLLMVCRASSVGNNCV